MTDRQTKILEIVNQKKKVEVEIERYAREHNGRA